MGQITNRNQRVCGPVAALLYCILGAAALVAGDAAECILFLHHPKQGPRRPPPTGGGTHAVQASVLLGPTPTRCTCTAQMRSGSAGVAPDAVDRPEEAVIGR